MDYLDYSMAKFQFIGVRKHFFKDKSYHISLFEDYFVMSDTPNSYKPKYRIPLTLETKISWEIKKHKDGVILIGFQFPYNKVRKLMTADSALLFKFKQLIQLKVTFDGIGELFLPILQIGKGSSAKVYSAKSVLDNKVYAIKAIEKAFLKQNENNQGMLAYKSEVNILQQLSPHCDNFLTLQEIYEGDNTFYLVTSLLEGFTLNEEIERIKAQQNKKFTPPQIKLIMRKLLQNLTVLHSHRIIHRDLKPDNLMFANKQDPSSLVLVDFGLAIYETEPKFLFPKCGTPGYVAPEVLQSRMDFKYNCKADLFSVGCIFYKLLTGINLFLGSSFEEVLQSNKRCQFDLTVPNDAYTDVSLNLLTQLLQKAPKLRISAQKALEHPYFDNGGDFSTQVQSYTPRLINLQKIQIEEQESKYGLEVNEEKDDEEVHKIPELKRCSLLSEISQSPRTSQRPGLTHTNFFHKEPLSSLKAHRISLLSPLQKIQQ